MVVFAFMLNGCEGTNGIGKDLPKNEAKEQSTGEPKVIAAIGNTGGVQNGPKAPSTFKTEKECTVTQIYTYHYFFFYYASQQY